MTYAIAMVALRLAATRRAMNWRASHEGDGNTLHVEARDAFVEVSLETKHDLLTHTMSREEADELFGRLAR